MSLSVIGVSEFMLQDELGLNRELMFKLPLEKRWELYLSKQKVATIRNEFCIVLVYHGVHESIVATQQFPGIHATQKT